MTGALREIIGFEKSTRFFWFFENFIAVLRMFIERVIMLVVFLSSVKDFIDNRSTNSIEQMGMFEAFSGIGSAIALAVMALGIVGLVNLQISQRKKKFLSKSGNWLKPPDFFQNGKEYKNFSKLWISSMIAPFIMLWYGAAFAVPFFFLALLTSYPIKRALDWRGGFSLLLGIFGSNILDLAILSVYFFSLCVYIYINGTLEFGIGSSFILVLVPRVPFGFLANFLARQDEEKK